MRALSYASPILAALLLAGCGDPKPNLVIIAIDTLRPDHLGCYGSARDTSPNLDAWSKDAVVFENAQSAAPWTAPSLLSLMTSLYPNVHGVMRFPEPGRMNERVTTLAEVLKGRGYATAAFTDGGYAKPQFGLAQGFDLFPLNHGDTPHNHASNLEEPSRLRPNVDRTLQWLDEFEDEPFFLFFHTYEVHGPYRPPEDEVRRFRPGYDEKAEHAAIQHSLEELSAGREIDAASVRLILAHSEHCGAGLDSAKQLGPLMRKLDIGNLEPERMQFWRDLYDGEIHHTDAELARLLARLDTPKLRENTVVVFVSDHGEGFGEHGTSQHGNVLHEEDLRVLLMMRAPGVAAKRVRDVVRSIDVMPTALELLGVARDDLPLQGRSLAPSLRGETLNVEPSFSHALSRSGSEDRLWSVRKGKWRLVWDEAQNAGRLYDLEADPGETADVAVANAQVAEQLLGLLRSQCQIDAAFRARASGPIGTYEIDDAMREELRKLGYVEDGAPIPPPQPLTPPSFCGN